MRSFFTELKKRCVYRVAIGYAVAAWLIVQIAATVLPAYRAPDWVLPVFITLVAIGFPIALVLAWAFEVTPSGIRTEVGSGAGAGNRKQGAWLVAALGLAIGGLTVGGYWFWQTRARAVATRPPLAAASPAQQELQAANNPSDVLSKSIAVLPFQNLSKDEENAFFADGVQEEILTTLAKVADLKVISRTSVMQYKEIEKRNLPEIAQALKVAHVLEGSVQRSANRVRVTAQLIDARTDAHLWADRYDRDLADVFAIQTEIAEKIAQQLRARLSPTEKAAIEAKPTQDLTAYDLYLRAKGTWRTPNAGREDRDAAVRLLDQAVARDPKFVAAFCLLARVHLSYYWMALDETPERLALAENAIEAAARLQPDAGEVHLARAFFHYWGNRDFDAALAELAVARRSLPNDSDAIFLTGSLQRRQGRWDEATGHLHAAAALDPRDVGRQTELATIYRQQHRFAEAAEVLDRALALEPDNFELQRARAELDLLGSADLRRMQEVATGAAKSAPSDQGALFRMQTALAQRDYAAAQEALAACRLREINQAAGFVVPREYYEGLIADGLGNSEQARASFLAARERAAARVAARSTEGIAFSVLGQIEARLGHKEEALRQAERGVELYEASGDELQKGSSIIRLAAICSRVGESDRALDLLEKRAKLPNGPTYGLLRLNPDWDPLRSHRRFEKLVASLAPKNAPPAR